MKLIILDEEAVNVGLVVAAATGRLRWRVATGQCQAELGVAARRAIVGRRWQAAATLIMQRLQNERVEIGLAAHQRDQLAQRIVAARRYLVQVLDDYLLR